MTRYISVTDTAKLLRAALKAAHPGVKFSVRSDSYAGGASINVSWTDGPARDVVERTTNLYRGATFDGMTDSMNYRDSVLVGTDGQPEVVSFGADFIFTHRAISAEAEAALGAEVRAALGEDLDEGRYYEGISVPGMDRLLYGNFYAMVRQLAEARAAA